MEETHVKSKDQRNRPIQHQNIDLKPTNTKFPFAISTLSLKPSPPPFPSTRTEQEEGERGGGRHKHKRRHSNRGVVAYLPREEIRVEWRSRRRKSTCAFGQAATALTHLPKDRQGGRGAFYYTRGTRRCRLLLLALPSSLGLIPFFCYLLLFLLDVLLSLCESSLSSSLSSACETKMAEGRRRPNARCRERLPSPFCGGVRRMAIFAVV